MHKMLTFPLLISLATILRISECSEPELEPSTSTPTVAPHNGFGEKFAWVGLEDGYKLAKAENKPLMLIIHKSWCGACKALKPEFADSAEILELSEKFIMVNTMDDDEPRAEDGRYTPDGGYIPRILFFKPSGTLLRDMINVDGVDKYKYYYYEPQSIWGAMTRVLDYVHGSTAPADGQQKTEL